LAEAGRTVAADLDLDGVIARSTPHTEQSIEFSMLTRNAPNGSIFPLALRFLCSDFAKT
jgi:hypothetical protein